MGKYELFKNILMVDSAMMAGLLILISLFPFDRPANHQCDPIDIFSNTIYKHIGLVATVSFVFFSLASVVSVGTVFVNNEALTDGSGITYHKKIWRPKLARRVEHFSKYVVIILTFMGFLMLFILALDILLSFGLPDHIGCYSDRNEGLSIGDSLSVTK